MLKDTPKGGNLIIEPKANKHDEDEGEAKREVIPREPTFETVTSFEGSDEHKVEFLFTQGLKYNYL